MKKTLILVCVVAVMGLGAGEAMGLIEYNWVGPTSGSADWDNAANWDSAGYPWIDYQDVAIISDTITGDRDITTPGVATAVNKTYWTANGAYENRLTLGNDFQTWGLHQDGWFNPSKDATKMVLDLNGNTFTTLTSWFLVPDMTIEGPGTFFSNAAGGIEFSSVGATGNPAEYTAPVFGPDVMFKVQGSFKSHGGTVSHLGTTGYLALPNSLTATGNFAMDHMVNFGAGTQLIQGDIIVKAGDINAGPFMGGGVSAGPHLGGSFIDTNTDQNGRYNTGRITFVGGGNEQTLDIRRQSDMRLVIDPCSHVVLGSDYYAPYDGTYFWISKVEQAAILDVGSHELTLTDLINEWVGDDAEAPTFVYEASGASGGITILGDIINDPQSTGLLLKKFHVEITASGAGGGWTGGDDFVLFNYGDQGSDAALYHDPSLLSVTLPGAGWSYDSFVDTGSQLLLTNMVPEPVSLVLLGLGSLALVRRRRR